jgi:hypothetical protein
LERCLLTPPSFEKKWAFIGIHDLKTEVKNGIRSRKVYVPPLKSSPHLKLSIKGT